MTSTHDDLGAPEIIDLRAELDRHYGIHVDLHEADGEDMVAYDKANAEIDASLAALADKLTPEGVRRMFHVASELVIDAISPHMPHKYHFDQEQIDFVRRQVEWLDARVPPSRS